MPAPVRVLPLRPPARQWIAVPPRATERPRPPAPAPAPARPAPPTVRTPPVAEITIPPVRSQVSSEPPIPRALPAGVDPDSQEARDWLVSALRAHAELRARSFYDTGLLIELLLSMRRTIGARNIKDLVKLVPDLGIGHMSAQKYLAVVRSFRDRDQAVRVIKVEKCYQLTVYAKAIGREGEAYAIWAANEPIRKLGGLTARTATAEQIEHAIQLLKQGGDDLEPTPEQKVIAERTEKVVRELGLAGADAYVVRRGRKMEIAIMVPLETLADLEATLVAGIARFGPRLARRRPALFETLRAKGWNLGRPRR